MIVVSLEPQIVSEVFVRIRIVYVVLYLESLGVVPYLKVIRVSYWRNDIGVFRVDFCMVRRISGMAILSVVV